MPFRPGAVLLLVVIASLILALWIKTKNDSSKPLLVSVSGNDLPSYIELPGEQDKTKVYEYKEKPQLCQRCFEYGHRTKFCTRDVRCKKCCEISHMAETCRSTEKRCYHCERDYYIGTRTCSWYKYEEEIVGIQTKNKVSRGQAKLTMDSRNLN